MTFSELLAAYRIEDRTLFGLFQSTETVTLRFDLYHCDDHERCEDGMEYLLDIAVAPDQFRILSGPGERLSGDFSADILEARIEGDEIRLVADCSFYDAPRMHDIVVLALTGGEVSVTEYPAAEVA